MKNIIIFFLTIILFGFCAVKAQAKEESINYFDTVIRVNQDASIDVTETIIYDFGSAQKHGIIRDIPVKYKARGGNYNLRISDISVTDEKQEPHNYILSQEGQYKRVKIGDAEKYVTGQKTYVINYSIKRAINYFNDHDELYWNATGNEWEVPIEQASVKVLIPQPAKKDELQVECFQGIMDSENACENKNTLERSSGAEAVFSQTNLSYREGLTVVAGWPKGIVYQPTKQEAAIETAKDNWYFIFPVITLIALTILWYFKGRDPKGKGTIIAQFDVPDKLTPSQVGLLIDETLDRVDISAEIIHLATKGYIKINRIDAPSFWGPGDSDYLLEQTKEADSSLSEIEKKVLESIFKHGTSVVKEQRVVTEVKISELKYKFQKEYQSIEEMINKSVIELDYFKHNPRNIRAGYVVLALLVAFSGIMAGSMMQNVFALISLVLSGVIIFMFAFIMPRRTLIGVVTKEHLLGLKQYLSVAEKDRLEFHNAPEKSPQVFEKFLAYAMVMGVVAAWSKQFEDIYKELPSWYNDPSGAAFSPVLFSHQLTNFSSSVSSSMTAVHSSASSGGSGFSGGGFSGGGFGGGGGGSW